MIPIVLGAIAAGAVAVALGDDNSERNPASLRQKWQSYFLEEKRNLIHQGLTANCFRKLKTCFQNREKATKALNKFYRRQKNLLKDRKIRRR